MAGLMRWESVVFSHADILTFPGEDSDEAVPMTPGTGPGWYRLIHELCRRLEETPKPWPVCTDIKVDRSGRLCFYVDSATDDQWKIIELAEELSEEICDDCGAMKDADVHCCRPKQYP